MKTSMIPLPSRAKIQEVIYLPHVATGAAATAVWDEVGVFAAAYVISPLGVASAAFLCCLGQKKNAKHFCVNTSVDHLVGKKN